MEAPYSLASLPRLLDPQDGKIYAAPVIELRGSRKRKRNEVVVGIDGDGLSVYSINSQQATFAIPSQAYQCCEPVSTYTPAANGSPAKRHIYTVLKRGPSDTSRRLVRSSEDLVQEYGQPSKTEYILPGGNVVCLEALLSTSVASRILVTYEDGRLVIVDEELSSIESARLDADGIEYATFTDISAARKGLFRGRQDVLSVLGSTDQVGCFIVQSESTVSLRSYALNVTSGQFSIRHLDDLTIPFASTSLRSWSLNSTTSQLYCLCDGSISTFELSGITPQALATIKDRRAPITAFSSFSASTIVALAGRRLTLYDTVYGSNQGDVALDDTVVAPLSRKRKLESDEQEASLCSFSNTVIVASKQLLGVQLTQKLKSTSLSSVLGQSTMQHVNQSDDLRKDDRRWYTAVDEAIGNGAQALEDLVVQNFDIETMPEDTSMWFLSDHSIDLGRAQLRRALVILELLFMPIQPALDTPARLHLRVISSNVLRWLAVTGLLTAERLSTVRGVAVTNAQLASSLADSSFQLLQSILSLRVALPAAFSIECLRLLIRSLDYSPAGSVLALEANGHSDEAQLEQESAAAEREISNALTALTTGLETRSDAMRLVLNRVIAIPNSMLVKELRQGLELHDLLFFIHLLRMELADAGWTARYLDGEPDHNDEEPSPLNHAISTITRLIMAAIDAIGTSSWLIGMPDEEEYNLVDTLLAEVAVCIEGAYDAQYLYDHIEEVQLYAAALEAQSIKPARTQRGLVEVLTSTVADDQVFPLGGRGSVAPSRNDRRGKARDAVTGVYQLERIKV